MWAYCDIKWTVAVCLGADSIEALMRAIRNPWLFLRRQKKLQTHFPHIFSLLVLLLLLFRRNSMAIVIPRKHWTECYVRRSTRRGDFYTHIHYVTWHQPNTRRKFYHSLTIGSWGKSSQRPYYWRKHSQHTTAIGYAHSMLLPCVWWVCFSRVING